MDIGSNENDTRMQSVKISIDFLSLSVLLAGGSRWRSGLGWLVLS